MKRKFLFASAEPAALHHSWQKLGSALHPGRCVYLTSQSFLSGAKLWQETAMVCASIARDLITESAMDPGNQSLLHPGLSLSTQGGDPPAPLYSLLPTGQKAGAAVSVSGREKLHLGSW